MSQLTAAVMTGSPSTRPSQRKRWAATRPGSIGPMGESMGAVATAISWRRAQLGVEVEAELVGDHPHRLAEPGAEGVGHDARAGLLGRLAEQHPVADDVGGAVGADVGELLGPHVGDRPGQRRDHQREALGDAAGVDAGAVQRDAGRLAHRVEALAARRSGGKNQPSGVTTFLPDSRMRVDDARVGHERAVDDAVGVEGEQRRRRRCVAATPIGSPPEQRRRRRRRPSSRCAPSSPTSSRSGWPSTPSMAARPTPPVAHWITRIRHGRAVWQEHLRLVVPTS